jgi:glycerol-3-phosphate dehydrogenase
VREALHERKTFLEIAPHLTSHLPIMIAIHNWWQLPYFWVGAKMYDFLAGKQNMETSYFLSRGKTIERWHSIRKDNLVGSLVYYDGLHNDARMNVSLALTAVLEGAVVANHVEVTGLLKDGEGKITGATMKDVFTGDTWSTKATAVINATGPFTDAIRKMDDPTVADIVAPSLGTHVILPKYYSPDHMGLIDPNTEDGRVMFFLPWSSLNPPLRPCCFFSFWAGIDLARQGNTIVGTTDDPTTLTYNPHPTEKDIDWILRNLTKYIDPQDIRVRRGDVLAAWSGIRPLVRDPHAKNTESLVRSHLTTTTPSGLVTIAGGKWTTYRQMAEDAVDAVLTQFPGLGEKAGGCKTNELKLIGAEGWRPTLYLPLIQMYGVDTDVARHLVESYGNRAWTVAGLSEVTGERWPVRGIRLSKMYLYIEGEVRYAVRFEYAETAIDVLARRTRYRSALSGY